MWRLRSFLISAPGVIVSTIGMAAISLICSPFDPTGRLQHRMARRWARMLVAISFARTRVEGLEKLKPGQQYVVVANHSSYMDIPLMLSNLDLEIRFFAKKGLFSIPFMGWHLSRAGHIPVARGDARASLKSMLEAANTIHDRGISVVLFPEGGRTIQGLRPFKEGAAFLAIKAGLPVLPVGLSNMRGLLPMGAGLFRPATVTMRVGDPIETSALTHRDRAALNDQMRERLVGLLDAPDAELSTQQ